MIDNGTFVGRRKLTSILLEFIYFFIGISIIGTTEHS